MGANRDEMNRFWVFLSVLEQKQEPSDRGEGKGLSAFFSPPSAQPGCLLVGSQPTQSPAVRQGVGAGQGVMGMEVFLCCKCLKAEQGQILLAHVQCCFLLPAHALQPSTWRFVTAGRDLLELDSPRQSANPPLCCPEKEKAHKKCCFFWSIF